MLARDWAPVPLLNQMDLVGPNLLEPSSTDAVA